MEKLRFFPRHTHLFSLLLEGIIKIKTQTDEDLLAIGGGYLGNQWKNGHCACFSGLWTRRN